ncbi:MAG: hypothetical protein H6936_09700 [Burkholderiales bacterium]|nr:hypothetical protein [Nitrosomonas sp.]MCP5275105.1 hypothetical protein [Burkholderiales bacterium]
MPTDPALAVTLKKQRELIINKIGEIIANILQHIIAPLHSCKQENTEKPAGVKSQTTTGRLNIFNDESRIRIGTEE